MYSTYYNPEAKASKNTISGAPPREQSMKNDQKNYASGRNGYNKTEASNYEDGFVGRVRNRVFDLLNYLLEEETSTRKWQSAENS